MPIYTPDPYPHGRNSNFPLSEQYRLAAQRAVALATEAKKMEAHESHFLNKKIKDMGDLPVTHAERDVKASEWWFDYRERKLDAWAAAQLADIEAETIRLRFWEQNNQEANRRKEIGL